jgi:hypothetical protein
MDSAIQRIQISISKINQSLTNLEPLRFDLRVGSMQANDHSLLAGGAESAPKMIGVTPPKDWRPAEDLYMRHRGFIDNNRDSTYQTELGLLNLSAMTEMFDVVFWMLVGLMMFIIGVVFVVIGIVIQYAHDVASYQTLWVVGIILAALGLGAMGIGAAHAYRGAQGTEK